MKILTVSDNVLPQLEDSTYLHRTYDDVTAIVSCGDMPSDYIDFLATVLNHPLYYVRGNHDTDYSPGDPGGVDLHKNIQMIGGLSFAGIEGCIKYSGGPAQYTEFDMWMIILSMLPALMLHRLTHGRPLDVLVTHSPVRGIHDLPDPAHRGFKSFLSLLKWVQPRYMIHGHVNTYDQRKATQTQFAATTIININPVKVLEINP